MVNQYNNKKNYQTKTNNCVNGIDVFSNDIINIKTKKNKYQYISQINLFL